ncbi:MAG: hypothetical protein ACOCXM_00545 [Myxococcota bacterium]
MGGVVPSIKGSVFEGLVTDLKRVCDERGLSGDALLEKLEPSDLDHFHEKILLSAWYDVRVFDRMARLLLELEGKGDVEYLRERGRKSARRLLEAGLYQQMEYLRRTELSGDPDERLEAFGRDLRLLTTMSSSILNFSVWNSHRDPDHPRRYVIEVTEAEPYPDVLAWNTEGFINAMAQEHDGTDRWRWQRPARDRLVFRMTSDL